VVRSPGRDLRARDHALHHLLDHRAAMQTVIPKFEQWREQGRSASESSLRQLVT